MANASTTNHVRPVALVTGGARRVGRSTVLSLAQAGCDVIVTFRGSRDEAEATVAEAIRLGASRESSRAFALDLFDLDQVHARARSLAAEIPRLDVLVLNASGYERSPLAELTGQQLLHAYTVNAASAAILASHLSPKLAASSMPGGGAIVAMCDIHAMGEHGLPRSRDFLAYSMSKAALAEMVRSLARELAPRVRVNGVAPGVVAWPEHGYESDAAAQEAYLGRVPLARSGTPEEAAEVIRWLAMHATYITGEIVRLDGGRNMV
jgi:pteridine reductase